MAPTRFYPLRVAQVEVDTRDASVISFDVPEALRETFRYEPGQHLTVRTQIEGTEIRRSYSICASAAEQRLRIAIKRVDDGLFSGWAAEHMKPGATLDCLPPAGHFGVPIEAGLARHHVAFAAGSGITPVLSIIKTVLEVERDSRVTLFYGNRASSSVMFREAIEDLKDRYTTRFNLVFILSREKQEIDLFNGRIDAAKCDALLTHWIDPASIDVAYICGPQAMMADVLASLQRHGVARERIRLELFDSGLPKGARAQPKQAVEGARTCAVTVVQDGRSRVFEFEKGAMTLLDAGLDQGLELPYSCKGGVCSTCRCKLTAGEVDMDANYALEDYEVARGYILTCQSFPVSDALTLNYDE
ncbi:MAG: phenylacetate-CoA oxygenase/reductase subunit PaaK [Nevskiaceae bacterium]|nr:MAG: phenylacetate-CoA oxygenase/reductase subunit PaaK [Nevskiaceae bacterium]TBR74248.1 MAG: phenylacetate-CoA oxygenase/reductase subunit PaaK [Nevskiaceae bacterium]